MNSGVENVGRPPLAQIFRAQKNVLAALMLRDVKTRFGSAPGFLIAIAWPLAHILVLVGLSVLIGRIVPYGDSAVLWFAVGTTPFMIASYTSRFMMIGLLSNRPLLTFPAINIFDILLSRVLIEMIVAASVLVSLTIILTTLDVDFMPRNIPGAVSALAVSLLLGIGLGIVNSIMAMIVAKWMYVYTLCLILLWITSGAYFIPSTLHPDIRAYLYYHPMLHCIEWAREAYFSGYHSLLLDKTYVICLSLVFIASGLVLERLIRGRLLSG